MKNSKLKSLVALVLLSLVLVVSACSSADPAQVRAVTNDVMCPCGSCTLVLIDCGCPTAEEVKGLIEKSVSRGRSTQTILNDLVNRYGSQVLATKTHS